MATLALPLPPQPPPLTLNSHPTPIHTQLTPIIRLRLLLIASWGVYPISYLLPLLGQDINDPKLFMWRQVGYTVADVLAKCVFGLTIFKIARMKSIAEGMKDDH